MSMLGVGISPCLPILGPSGPLPAPSLSAALVNWRKGGTYGRPVLVHGDSTVAPPAPPWGGMASKLNAFYNTPGGLLDSVSLQDGGEIGQTLANVMNGTAAYNITWVNAQTFDLLIARWGINDVRTGTTNLSQLTTLLTNYVNAVLAAKPNACIILVTPNSFLLDDPTSSGYVVPLASAQAYTDILWGAYDAVKNLWPNNVVVYDSQTLVYGRTCRLSVNNPLMQDIIHPVSAAAPTPDGYSAQNLGVATLMQPRGWPATQVYATDPFLPETMLGLNGNALTDYRGRHTLTQSPAGVTASGGWLNFSGGAALKVLDNLTDFMAGIWNGSTQFDAKLTIDLQLIPDAAHSQPNGMIELLCGTGLKIGNDSDANNNNAQVSGFGATILSSDTIPKGVRTDYSFEFGRNKYSTYKNGVQTNLAYSNADFNTNAGTLWIGQENSGWAAVVYYGLMRLRWTNELRYNHAPTIATYPNGWQTT